MYKVEWIGKLGPYGWVLDYIYYRNKIDSWIGRLSDGSLTDEQIPVVKKYVGELIKDEKEHIKLVSKFKSIEQKILRLKYIDGLTLDEVADRLKTSRGHIANIHAEIMKPFNLLEGMEEQFRLFKQGTKRRKK